MTQMTFFRNWISFLKKARFWTDLIGLIAVTGLFAYYAPSDIFNSGPATGGDTGSHFWPLVTLVKQGLPHWHVRVWNPGNLGGEPHLTHYFPFPWLLMAFLSLFMPLGRAFNIGSILPVFVFPLCVYVCFRGLKTRFPIPILAAAFSLSFLYNESFSMWGGNVLSTLAGQFAHVYAFDFLLLGVGSLYWEMDRKRFPWISLLMFAGVLLSHFYVALFLPPIFLCFLFLHSQGDLKERFLILFKVGMGSLLLSAWYVIPMLHNSKWNTAFGLKWAGDKLFLEAFPKIFWPFIAAVLLLGLVTALWGWRKHWIEREWRLFPAVAISCSLLALIYFYSFPTLGLVDVRVIPTVELLLCLLVAFFAGIFFRQHFSSVWTWFVTIPLLALAIWWPARQITNLPYWLKWNYSSWDKKEAYPDLMKLTRDLKGSFSDPRVIYENSQRSNAAGTMRVFEMLPYFANRATLESVYMQATILAPETFYLQALISKTPSCPFPNYECTTYAVSRIADYLPLMGVSQMILISDEVKSQADQVPFLHKAGDYGFWSLYNSTIPAPLVEVMKEKPQFLEEKDFKKAFYRWFLNYKKGNPFLVDAPEKDRAAVLNSIQPGECHPQVTVNFDELKLKTDCPGRFHILKFAFHSTFKASTGDSLYMTSPGFIGIIPSQSEVVIRWGQHWLWNFADAISWITALVLLVIYFRSRRKRGAS